MKQSPQTALQADYVVLNQICTHANLLPQKRWVPVDDRRMLIHLAQNMPHLMDETIAEAQRIANRRGFLRGSACGIGVGLTAIGVNALTQYLQSPTYWCGVIAGALCAALVIYASRRG